MKHICIFSIVLLTAILTTPLDVLACDDLKTRRDTAKRARDLLKAEVEDHAIQNHWLVDLLSRIGNENPVDDYDDDLRDLSEHIAYRET